MSVYPRGAISNIQVSPSATLCAIRVTASGGAKTVAEILNLVDSSAEKNILQSLEAEDPDLAAEVKNMMFVFEDISKLADRAWPESASTSDHGVVTARGRQDSTGVTISSNSTAG